MAKSLRQKTVNQILYISIGCVIAILILFIALFNIFNRNSKKQNLQLGENQNNSSSSVEQASTQIGKTIGEVENEIELEDETVADNLSVELEQNDGEEDFDVAESFNNTEQTATDTNNEITNGRDVVTEEEEDDEEKIPDPVFTMPVEGEIVKQYGKEKLLYSNTLKEWTTHLGIDIKADKTSVVKSTSDGVVKSIKNDPRYGLTVVIEHAKGYASIYSNLLTAEFVTVGEEVKSGQTIGTVGNTATFEIVDEPHLHFEITKDGENIDPEMCIK